MISYARQPSTHMNQGSKHQLVQQPELSLGAESGPDQLELTWQQATADRLKEVTGTPREFEPIKIED
jgi:hypothetical protein